MATTSINTVAQTHLHQLENIQENMYLALSMSFFAGLATVLGGCIVLFYGKLSEKKLGHMLGFSAGVMLYISFMDMLPEAIEEIGHLHANLWFFGGMTFFALILRLFPEPDFEEINKNNKKEKKNKIAMTSFITLLMCLHNFPEGFAVYLSSLKSASVGMPLALAIAMHNIPEGMAVASPIYGETSSKLEAIKYTAISGMCEPIGAILFGVIFIQYINYYVIHSLFALVAGMMVFMSVKDLLPEATKRLQSTQELSYSVMFGMFLIFLSIYYLKQYFG